MNRYPDHHIFTIDDLKEIKKHFEKLESKNKIILTTEKDAVRLHKYINELSDYPIYVLPIKHRFLFDESPLFESSINRFIGSFRAK
jgi:tetraacyldisaccharide 4'-kinase